MSDLGTKPRDHRGENGFTLIELLVVVTIIGILAAIVSVSVGGFTGKASVQAHKSTINSVQAAVDAYIGDHYDGSGVVVPPTSDDATLTAASATSWYNTNGVVETVAAANVVYKKVDFPALTKSTSTIIGNTTRAHGPYLRLGGNGGPLVCVFANTVNNVTTPSAPSGEWRVILCIDTGQTAQ